MDLLDQQIVLHGPRFQLAERRLSQPSPRRQPASRQRPWLASPSFIACPARPRRPPSASLLNLTGQLGDELSQLGAALRGRQVHAEAELGVVLEQGVRPGGAMALLVDGVGDGRSGAAIDGGAARRVGDHHPVAEQLGDQLDVRGLAAARAGAGELEQRLAGTGCP